MKSACGVKHASQEHAAILTVISDRAHLSRDIVETGQGCGGKGSWRSPLPGSVGYPTSCGPITDEILQTRGVGTLNWSGFPFEATSQASFLH